MELKSFFLKANNELEYGDVKPRSRKVTCKRCQKETAVAKIRKNNFVCPNCGYYFPVRARRRILMLSDKRSFVELFGDLESKNILDFPEYDSKLQAASQCNGKEP